MKKRVFACVAVLTALTAVFAGCADRSAKQNNKPDESIGTTALTPADPNGVAVYDYSSDPFFLGADRIRGDLKQMIGEEKSPVYLLSCFLESCKTPLDGVQGEQFLFEAFDESEYHEKYSGVYDDCFTLRLCRRFDVGDGEKDSLLLSLEMKFTPDESFERFTGVNRFDTADALGQYAGTSPLFVYLTEQGIAAQEIELNMSYTN